MPPSIILLRPLSVIRSVYVVNEFSDLWFSKPFSLDRNIPFISLEGALTSVVRPLFKATNAVGGLTDILGMGRSGTAGEFNDTDAGWKMLVRSMLEISDVVLVLPDMSEGLRWELEELRKTDRVSECIFVLLPKQYEWSDGGNRLAFTELLNICDQHLLDDGGFLFGDPSDPKTLRLGWSSMWDGSLTKEIAQRCTHFSAVL